MAIVNLKKRQIECKIVYYGPGRCGKTTNLEYIHKAFKNQVKGDMVSIKTDGDRTLFFDFLPLEIGKLKGCDVRVQLYTYRDRCAMLRLENWFCGVLTVLFSSPILWRSGVKKICWH